jgi:membrane protein
MDESRTFGVAAEMAFWLFLALVPLAAVAGMLVARFGLGLDLAHPILEAMPHAAHELIVGELAHASASVSLTPFAGLAYVWLASSGIHAVFDGFEAQTKVRWSWVHKRLWSLVSCVALTAAALVLGLGGWASAHFHVGPPLIPRLLVSAIVLYLVVAWLYRVGLPVSVRTSMPLWPGTLVVAVTSLGCAVGYGAFLSIAGDGSVYLAGLAVTAVTMTLLYLLAFALLLGLVVNRTLASFRRASRRSSSSRRQRRPSSSRAVASRARRRGSDRGDAPGAVGAACPTRERTRAPFPRRRLRPPRTR